MQLVFLFLLALGLSFDTFAVSMTFGCINKKMLIKQGIKISLIFAVFQALMPLLGWLLGFSIAKHVEAFDHWIAFGLLSFVGIRMIAESLRKEGGQPINISDIRVIFSLALATSIDAFIVGIVFASIEVNLLLATLIIGFTTFMAAMIGILFGKTAGHFFGRKIEIIGALILIAIGIKILIEHLGLA